MGGEGGWLNNPHAICPGHMGGEGGWLNNPHTIWEGREAGSMIHTPYGRGGRLAQ